MTNKSMMNDLVDRINEGDGFSVGQVCDMLIEACEAINRLESQNADLQHTIDAINHPARSQTPAPNLITLPSGGMINLDNVAFVDIESNSDWSSEPNIRLFSAHNPYYLEGDDRTAFLNYADRIAPHVLPSGLTAGDDAAEANDHEIR